MIKKNIEAVDNSINSIIYRYSDMVYKLAYARMKNKTDAEDLFQEVFLRYYKANLEFNSEEHCKAWLIKVTVNLSKNFLTSAWKKRSILIETPLWLIDKDHTNPSDDDKSDVFYAVMKLPEKYRVVIHLHYYEDFSITDIANILDRKESTVKTQLFRARKLLKQDLKGEYDYV